MFHMEFTVLKFLLVLPAAYVVGLFSSWLVHFVQHQTVAGVPLYLPHFQHHHLRVDAPDEWQRQFGSRPGAAFWSSIIGHGMWVFLALCIVALYAAFFTPWIAFAFTGTGVAVGLFHWHLHQVAHDEPGAGWLSRSRWVQRERAFHQVHHLTSADFANASNFAFGDPLSSHLIDYVLGTLHGGRETREKRLDPAMGVKMELALARPPSVPAAERLATESK